MNENRENWTICSWCLKHAALCSRAACPLVGTCGITQCLLCGTCAHFPDFTLKCSFTLYRNSKMMYGFCFFLSWHCKIQLSLYHWMQGCTLLNANLPLLQDKYTQYIMKGCCGVNTHCERGNRGISEDILDQKSGRTIGEIEYLWFLR